MWGYLCDKYGKKKSLLLAGSSLAATTLMFGFSYNYLWTVLSRSLQGLCMGLNSLTYISIVKSVKKGVFFISI